ncbi:hypothetical protein BX616_011308, partial [Lobosporangium transversale]
NDIIQREKNKVEPYLPTCPWRPTVKAVFRNAEEDCSVNARKMLKLSEEVVFKQTVKKYIDPNMGFSGTVGKATPQAAMKSKLACQGKREPKP